jgi:hypothetical protein
MKKTLIIVFLISIVGCRNNEVEPQQLYGDWYFLGTFNHRAYTAIDYNKIDLSKLSLIRITNNSMTTKTKQFEYRSNIELSNEFTHPQNLSIGGKIVQKNILLNYFGQSNTDSLFADGLRKGESYYLQKADAKYYSLSFNFENSDDNYFIFVKAR